MQTYTNTHWTNNVQAQITHKIRFPSLNMFNIAASDEPLFGVINLFSKCGPR